jgi:hypothetical protein
MCLSGACAAQAAICATGSASACASLPCACETSADAEVQAEQLRQQVANLGLREVVLRAQHAYERQRPRPDLAAGHTRGQRPTMGLAAAAAPARIAPVLVHLSLHRRHIEHLVAQRLLGHGVHRRAAFAHRHRRALDDAINLALIEHGPATALVPGLGAALAQAGTALRPVAFAGAVRGRRLRGVARIEIEPLLHHLQLLLQLGQPLQQHLDHQMTLGHRLGQRQRQRLTARARLRLLRGIDHARSVRGKSKTCKMFLIRSLTRLGYPLRTWECAVAAGPAQAVTSSVGRFRHRCQLA